MKRMAAVAAATCAVGGVAFAEGQESFDAAIAQTKPLIDTRLRMEDVDQDGIARDAHAITLRARLGFETGKLWHTSLLAEGEGIVPFESDYRPDPAVATKTAYPVVADAETYEINRLQLTNTSLPGTTITLGRQRINLDDQRFVGAVGWRQNEQTFDAVRIVNKSIENLTLDATWLDQVNRVFGKESPQGRYHGDSVLLNAGYQTKIGRITAFGYLLDIDPLPGVAAAVRDATSTYGLRFAGDRAAGKIKVSYAASYATQKDRADNPLDFSLDYKMAEVGATWRQFNLTAGTERMEGDGVKGFTTPLATLHKFNGWADKFLTTPANGLDDDYLTFTATLKSLGMVDTLSFVAGYHNYDADRISASYGDEWDLSVAAKVKRMNLMLKYAKYQQGVLASALDTDKLWAQLEFVW